MIGMLFAARRCLAELAHAVQVLASDVRDDKACPRDCVADLAPSSHQLACPYDSQTCAVITYPNDVIDGPKFIAGRHTL